MHAVPGINPLDVITKMREMQEKLKVPYYREIASLLKGFAAQIVIGMPSSCCVPAWRRQALGLPAGFECQPANPIEIES